MTARLAMLAAVLATAILVQAVVAPAIAVAGVRPDLVTLVVVGVAVADGARSGSRFGFVAGLAVDLSGAGTHLVGLSALVLLLVGYAAGAIRPYLSGTGLVGQVAVAGAATVVAVLSSGLLAILLEVVPVGLEEVLRRALLAGAYNAVLAPLALPALARLAARYPHTPAGTPWTGGRG